MADEASEQSAVVGAADSASDGSAVVDGPSVSGRDPGAEGSVASPVTVEATVNPDGTVVMNGKTYEVEEVDPAGPVVLDNPADCAGCGETLERHALVMGKCQPCNTAAQAQSEGLAAKLAAFFKGL